MSRSSAKHAAPTGDWQQLMADTGAAIADFGQAVLDGGTADYVAAENSLHAALASHAAVVSAIRAAASPWDMDRATVLAETKHILDELLSVLA
jgi:hypothetical protein